MNAYLSNVWYQPYIALLPNLWGTGYFTVSKSWRTVRRLYSRLGVQTILMASQYLDQSYKCSEAEPGSKETDPA